VCKCNGGAIQWQVKMPDGSVQDKASRVVALSAAAKIPGATVISKIPAEVTTLPAR
jgi:hypothetical protein